MQLCKLAAKDSKSEVKLHTSVKSVTKCEDGHWRVAYATLKDTCACTCEGCTCDATQNQDTRGDVTQNQDTRGDVTQNQDTSLQHEEIFDAVVMANPLEGTPIVLGIGDTQMENLIHEYCDKRRMHTTYATFVRCVHGFVCIFECIYDMYTNSLW